jgi:hypothetical protein
MILGNDYLSSCSTDGHTSGIARAVRLIRVSSDERGVNALPSDLNIRLLQNIPWITGAAKKIF